MTDLLNKILPQFTESELKELVTAARTEALAEAKTLLKEHYLREILRRVAAIVAAEANTPAQRTKQMGVYIYGVISTAGPHLEVETPGVGDAPVGLLIEGDLRAVVSGVPLDVFGKVPLEAHLQDVKWLTGQVQRHEAVLQAVLKQQAVIPMRFCTIYPTETEARSLLQQQQAAYKRMLIKLINKQEWAIKIYSHRATASTPLHSTVEQLETELAVTPQGQAHLLQKKSAPTQQAKQSQQQQQWPTLNLERLSELATHTKRLPLEQPTETGPDLIHNGAYLIDLNRLPDFQDELDRLTATYEAHGLRFEMVGPWPPYNFVTATPEPAG